MFGERLNFYNQVLKGHIKYVRDELPFGKYKVERKILNDYNPEGLLPFDNEYDMLNVEVYKKVFVKCSIIPKKTMFVTIYKDGTCVERIGDESDTYELFLEVWSNPKQDISKVKKYNPFTKQLSEYEAIGPNYLYQEIYQDVAPYRLQSRYLVTLDSGNYIFNSYGIKCESEVGILPNIADKFNKQDGDKKRPKNWNKIQEYIYQSRAARL